MANLVTSALDTLRSYAGSLAWGPLVRLSRSSVLALLQSIEVGQLNIVEKDGSEIVCGNGALSRSEVPVARLKVLKEVFWLRLALFADMVSRPTICVASRS